MTFTSGNRTNIVRKMIDNPIVNPLIMETTCVNLADLHVKKASVIFDEKNKIEFKMGNLIKKDTRSIFFFSMIFAINLFFMERETIIRKIYAITVKTKENFNTVSINTAMLMEVKKCRLKIKTKTKLFRRFNANLPQKSLQYR